MGTTRLVESQLSHSDHFEINPVLFLSPMLFQKLSRKRPLLNFLNASPSHGQFPLAYFLCKPID